MSNLCRFIYLHDGSAVFVNPTAVRCVTPSHGVSGVTIHFDGDHRIEVGGTLEYAVKALDDANRS
jgi:hypothetical protein